MADQATTNPASPGGFDLAGWQSMMMAQTQRYIADLQALSEAASATQKAFSLPYPAQQPPIPSGTAAMTDLDILVALNVDPELRGKVVELIQQKKTPVPQPATPTPTPS